VYLKDRKKDSKRERDEEHIYADNLNQYKLKSSHGYKYEHYENVALLSCKCHDLVLVFDNAAC